MTYRCRNIVSVLFKLHQRSARRIASMTPLANQNLTQVRTWCHSALLSPQEDADWQTHFLVISHVVPCSQAVWDLLMLSLCSCSP